MNTAMILGVAALICGILILVAPQFERWAVGIWLLLYGIFAFVH